MKYIDEFRDGVQRAITYACALGVPQLNALSGVPPAGATDADVRAYCEQNLTGYKRPRVIEFRTELPKTPVGKVLRRELRAKPGASVASAPVTTPV